MISIDVNGVRRSVQNDPRMPLLWLVRENFLLNNGLQMKASNSIESFVHSHSVQLMRNQLNSTDM